MQCTSVLFRNDTACNCNLQHNATATNYKCTATISTLQLLQYIATATHPEGGVGALDGPIGQVGRNAGQGAAGVVLRG